MSALYTILTVLVIIASVLITLIVLLQNGKGGGLASNFVAGNQTFGVRQTADILEKITWGLVIFIFAVSIITAFVKGGDNNKQDLSGFKDNLEAVQSQNTEEAIDMSALPAATSPEAEPEAQN